MKKQTTRFIIQPSAPSKQVDEYKGHATLVERRHSVSGGAYATKHVAPDGEFRDMPDKWMTDAIYAKKISDAIRAKNNPAYEVPKTFISHGKVREQFIDGPTLRELGDDFIRDNIYEYNIAIGNLINDMSELGSVRRRDEPATRISQIRVKSIDELKELLSNYRNEISMADSDTICNVFEFLRDRPENNEFVFYHDDLHNGNILWNARTNKIAIIDFEMSQYITKMQIMYYRKITANQSFWDYVDKLPRTKNPNLRWEFNEHIHQLYDFMFDTVIQLRKYMKESERPNIQSVLPILHRNCDAARFHLAQLKLHEHTPKTPTAALIHISQKQTDR